MYTVVYGGRNHRPGQPPNGAICELPFDVGDNDRSTGHGILQSPTITLVVGHPSDNGGRVFSHLHRSVVVLLIQTSLMFLN